MCDYEHFMGLELINTHKEDKNTPGVILCSDLVNSVGLLQDCA